MIVIDNFNQVLAQIESERGIARSVIISAIEQALVSACRRKFHDETILNAHLDPLSGEANIYHHKIVVTTPENPDMEISLEEAILVDSDAKIGGEVLFDVTPTDFGRIAAQTAKQVIIQRIREAEKTVIFDEFQEKIDTIITGTVQRVENRNYLINLGRVEAILFSRDQIPGELFQTKEKIRVYVIGVDKNSRGTFIQISRTHPGFLKKLFELEIPEIQDGIIEIMSIAREPGQRSKIAVKTNNPAIGAVGTCVGHMGSRIQSIIRELGNEKIDVLEWDTNPATFIANALKPAKISRVVIKDDVNKSAVVVVPNDQLSLAIGKNGINVRLSVKLTDWKLDILSETDFAPREAEIMGQARLSLIEKVQLEKEKIKEVAAAAPEPIVTHFKLAPEPEEEDAGLKVSELAKLLKIKTKDLIDEAKKVNVEISTIRSILTPDQVEHLKAYYNNKR